MWVFYGIVSACLLGVYDIFKKISLKNNAVVPVLFISTSIGALIFVPLIVLSSFTDILRNSAYFIPTYNFDAHLFFFTKAIIVTASWIFAYYAIKHLPITIVSPVRSSGPAWVVVGAMIFFNEKLSLNQWIGVIIITLTLYLFSYAGRKEGIRFSSNKWVFFMILATFIGSGSALYDKYLIGIYNRIAVQAWFTIYMVFVQFILLITIWYPKRKETEKFQWRWSIPLIAITLIMADFIYFYSLTIPGSLIAVVSPLRRTGVIITFFLGAILFKESNIRIKALILSGILTGIGFIVFS